MRFNPNKVEEWIFFAISAGAAVVSCLFLFMIIVEVIIHALPSLTWYFVVTPESATPHIGMGIANAIWGSILISLFATVLALPLALGTAVYLQKYAKKREADACLALFYRSSFWYTIHRHRHLRSSCSRLSFQADNGGFFPFIRIDCPRHPHYAGHGTVH